MAADALLLDLDRTLVDLQTYTDYAAALRDVEAIMGSWSLPDVPQTDWDHPTMACMSVLHALLGDARWAQVSEAIAVHERAAIPQSATMPTVLEARTLLTTVPTAVVTLLPTDVVQDVLAWHGMDVHEGGSVDMAFGRAVDLRPKPEPDGLLAACASLGVEPQRTVMIGDSSWDAEAARRAGVRFIGVPSSPDAGMTQIAGTFREAVERALA